MADAGGRARGLDVRAEVGCLVALVGATGVAIAQPVFDAFGDSPETFIFRHADGGDLVAFALAVALIPPLMRWSLGVIVGLVRPCAPWIVHGVSVGLVAGLLALQLASSWPWVLRAAFAL